jgi:hypothetical protein
MLYLYQFCCNFDLWYIFCSWLMKFDFNYFLLRVLRYYYCCVFPGFYRIQLTNKICGGNCSVEIRSSSWSPKVCPGLAYSTVPGCSLQGCFKWCLFLAVAQVEVYRSNALHILVKTGGTNMYWLLSGGGIVQSVPCTQAIFRSTVRLHPSSNHPPKL